MKILLFVTMLVTVAASVRPCLADPRPLKMSEAEAMVMAAVKDIVPGYRHLPGLGVDDHFKSQYAPNFVVFSVLWGNDTEGSTIGNFEVNMRTGDVFDGTICKEYTGLHVRRAKVRLSRRIGLDRTFYEKYRSGGEYC